MRRTQMMMALGTFVIRGRAGRADDGRSGDAERAGGPAGPREWQKGRARRHQDPADDSRLARADEGPLARVREPPSSAPAVRPAPTSASMSPEGRQRSDLVTAVPDGQNGAGSRVPIVLTAAGILKGSANTTVSCEAEVRGATKIRDIRVTAVKVGTLTTRQTVSPAASPAATTGSGKPVLISAKQGSPRDIVGGGTFQSVGSIPLSAGLWWIDRQGRRRRSERVRHRLRLPAHDRWGSGRRRRLGLRSAGPNPGDAVPFALVGIHEFASPGNVRWSVRAIRAIASATSSSTR